MDLCNMSKERIGRGRSGHIITDASEDLSLQGITPW